MCIPSCGLVLVGSNAFVQCLIMQFLHKPLHYVQCDLIGLFLKVVCDKFPNKIVPESFGDFLG